MKKFFKSCSACFIGIRQSTNSREEKSRASDLEFIEKYIIPEGVKNQSFAELIPEDDVSHISIHTPPTYHNT